MLLLTEPTVRVSVQANLEFRWTELIRSRLEGLTDEEYLLEPAVGCLSVRPDAASDAVKQSRAAQDPTHRRPPPPVHESARRVWKGRARRASGPSPR